MNPRNCKASENVALELEELNWMLGDLQYLASRVKRGEEADRIAVLTRIHNVKRSLKIINNAVKEASEALHV